MMFLIKALPILIFSLTGLNAQTASTPRIYRTYKLLDGTWIHSLFASGNFVYTGHQDRTVGQWDVVNGTLLRTFPEHSGDIVCMQVIGNNFFIGSDTVIAQWNLSSGQKIRTLSSPYVSIVAFETDGSSLFSKSTDGMLVQWDTNSGSIVRNISSSTHQKIWSSQENIYYVDGANVNAINTSTGTTRLVYTDSELASATYADNLDAIGNSNKVYRLNRIYNTTNLNYTFQLKRVFIGSTNTNQDAVVYTASRRFSQLTLSGNALLWISDDSQKLYYFDTAATKEGVTSIFSFDKEITAFAVNPASPSFVFAVTGRGQVALFRLFKSDGSAEADSSAWVTSIQPPPIPPRVLSSGEVAWISIVSIAGTCLIATAAFWIFLKTKAIREGYRHQASKSTMTIDPAFSSKKLPMGK